jgi:hypothetical protein
VVTQGNVIAAKAVRWLNPMASLVDFYRDILYGQPSNPCRALPALDGVFRTLLTALVILASAPTCSIATALTSARSCDHVGVDDGGTLSMTNAVEFDTYHAGSGSNAKSATRSRSA